MVGGESTMTRRLALGVFLSLSAACGCASGRAEVDDRAIAERASGYARSKGEDLSRYKEPFVADLDEERYSVRYYPNDEDVRIGSFHVIVNAKTGAPESLERPAPKTLAR